LTRALTSIYVVCLLTLQTHIQLNLLGRYNYVSSVVELQAGDVPVPLGNIAEDQGQRRVSLSTERAYLTFSWWLLHRGWREVMEKVQSAVEGVFEK
jgi:peroxin-3